MTEQIPILTPEQTAAADAPYWAMLEGLVVDGRPFDFQGRSYQLEMMRPKTDDGKVKRNEVIRSGSQIGKSMMKVIEITHGAIYGMYPQGVIYYFPSGRAVEHFSKTRFKPFINDNPQVKKFVNDIDAIQVRRIGGTNVNFFGCSATTMVGGEAKDSTSVRSTPADWVLLDERDLFDDEMASQVNQRLGNSKICRRSDVGTPKLPDDGIDRLYKKCLVPETKILKTDLRWVRLSEIKEGDELVGFDEEPVDGKGARCYRRTKVIGWEKIQRPCVRITLDDNTVITSSIDHRWLTQTKNRGLNWKITRNLILGDKLVSIGMWETGVAFEDGYISGVYDGEAHIYRNGKKASKGGANLGFSQNQGKVLDEVKRILDIRNFETKEYMHHKCHALALRGGLPEKLRFLGTYRPTRLMDKSNLVWEDVTIGHDHGNTKYPKITKMEYAGFIDVIALTTEHKTFIANGLLSHNSDQRRWLIKCDSCSKHTCMETEFPRSIMVDIDGKGWPVCVHCGAVIRRSNGQWIPDYPQRDNVGYWASQLLNPNRDLARVLKEFEDPETYDLTIAEFYRTVLGLPYVYSEDRLSEADVYGCCCGDQMKTSHEGPCAMGVDVGNTIHAVIGHKITNDRFKLIRMARVPDWNALHDLAQRYGVKSCVIDAAPESHKAKEFQKSEPYSVYLCFYGDHLKTFDQWNDVDKIVKVNRTEIFDTTHQMTVSPGRLMIPRSCEEVKEFAHQMCMAAKSLEEDKRTGVKIYRYRKVGDKEDHYRNALNYFYLACKKIGLPSSSPAAAMRPVKQDMKYSFN